MISIPAGITADEVRATAASLTEAEAEALIYDWELWARPEQLAPAGDWRNWLILAGRGWGKTRTGAEEVRAIADRDPEARIALIGPTAADVRDVMIEGESGILNLYPPADRPHYQSSKRRLTFRNGAQAFSYSAEEPERLRGPQHSAAYCDEIAVYPAVTELWNNLKFGLRLGSDPRVIVTTTPKPLRFLAELIADAGTVLTRGRTYDNRANLPPATLAEFERVYGGTRIGRQELDGELLEEAEGALWSRALIERNRVRVAPELVRVVVAIDPSVTAGPDSDECGIIVAGLGADGHGYILSDRSARVDANAWANRAVSAFDAHEADRIVAEVNNGGDLVEKVIRTVCANIPFEAVRASRGKVARAEPVAALYEQGKIHHVGAFRELEEEQVNFVPGALNKSPNRVDAMVWAMSYLMLKPRREGRVLSI